MSRRIACCGHCYLTDLYKLSEHNNLPWFASFKADHFVIMYIDVSDCEGCIN